MQANHLIKNDNYLLYCLALLNENLKATANIQHYNVRQQIRLKLLQNQEPSITCKQRVLVWTPT